MLRRNPLPYFERLGCKEHVVWTHLKSHETSPKYTYATFFVEKCQKRPKKAAFWEYLPKG